MEHTMKQKIRYATDSITSLIVNTYPPEKLVADNLFMRGITETEYFNMRKHFTMIGEPTVVAIANHLRDNWRTRT